MLPTLAHFEEFEPRYLADNFRPWEHAISPRELRAAFGTLAPPAHGRLMKKLGPDCLAYLDGAKGEPPDDRAEQIRAASKILSIYFWEIVYQRFPESYDAFSACQEFPFTELFPSNIFHGLRLAEVAAGSGKLTLHLANYAKEVVAIDPSEPLLRTLSLRSEDARNVCCKVGSFSAIPLPDASVDAVVSSMGFQISEERGGKSGLAEMLRVLRPRGEIRLVVGSQATEQWLRKHGFREIATPRSIVWSLPEAITPLLQTLLLSVGVPSEPRLRIRDRWLFVRPRPSITRLVVAFSALFRGSRPTEVFDRGIPWRPMGCSAMVLRR
ncbi:class I SAM-dependent methyltransferase [Rhizobium lentis]|uniref:SAM-dependent methyltransferase n=1 Tax=Rhizobium lentis TaxID=1138194 RepID=A0A7W9CYF4_9HYPH|nr:methyltransferase domain-containing protein [Rhizobium lentis]MBB4577133.1 SAM-dependent methyltransferase [Rhizobium lentis]MBB5553962.1 SAM-dependent methyltransferase [Rhizobium lentis]MBB5564524.1 SAM-dependent methyltransferase [Rhizobium lentis]MBB5571040.1 SAM-dependent methyltransferase [Rhizobium lentis]